MREFIVGRFDPRGATKLFARQEIRAISEFASEVRVQVHDSRLPAIVRLSAQYDRRDRVLYSSTWIERRYTERDWTGTTHAVLNLKRMFEPAGEECDTRYDESIACPKCGAGARQVGPLRLPTRKCPKSANIAFTIADEICVDAAFKRAVRLANLRGFTLRPIVDAVSGARSTAWYQLLVPRTVQVSGKTRVSDDPFRGPRRPKEFCPKGHLLGSLLLSELVLADAPSPGIDLMYTEQYFGLRQGLLRPYRKLVASKKFVAAMKAHRIRGLGFERALVETNR